MKITNIEEILNLDSLYLYCHKTQQYEKVVSINTIKTIRNDVITYIKGTDINGYPLYSQFKTPLFNQLKEKFQIIQQWEQNQ